MKIALLGYGKMGKTLHKLIDENPEDRIVLMVNSANASEMTIELLEKADVAIEFSTPETAVDNIFRCFECNVPVVVGTTGWLNRFDEVKDFCIANDKAMLYAANFSLGVNLFFQLNKQLAQIMKQWPAYDISMEETHHTAKKDAPSGTAIHLANEVINNSNKTEWVNAASTNKEELSILSFRKDDVKGEHTINWSSEEDSISITHSANNRLGFAKGALLASNWIVGKKGFFSMADVLGLEFD